MICIQLIIILVCFLALIVLIQIRNNKRKSIIEGFYNTNLMQFPIFTMLPVINSSIYGKYQAKRTDQGFKIEPDNAAEFNKTFQFPERTYDFYGKKNYINMSWKSIQEEKNKRKKNEKLDILELIPLIWTFQDKMFLEYRKYFDKVQCLKHYFNEFKSSRNMSKTKPTDWHKDNCDLTLDLNYDIKEGKEKYIGLDGIRSKMKMSDFGK